MAQLPAMKIRIGLHVGDVVLTDDDYLGNTVNKAARIAAAARGGEIVASSSVRSLLGNDPEFGFGEIQTVHLKGIEGLHEVTQVLPSKPVDFEGRSRCRRTDGLVEGDATIP